MANKKAPETPPGLSPPINEVIAAIKAKTEGLRTHLVETAPNRKRLSE